MGDTRPTAPALDWPLWRLVPPERRLTMEFLRELMPDHQIVTHPVVKSQADDTRCEVAVRWGAQRWTRCGKPARTNDRCVQHSVPPAPHTPYAIGEHNAWTARAGGVDQ